MLNISIKNAMFKHYDSKMIFCQLISSPFLFHSIFFCHILINISKTMLLGQYRKIENKLVNDENCYAYILSALYLILILSKSKIFFLSIFNQNYEISVNLFCKTYRFSKSFKWNLFLQIFANSGHPTYILFIDTWELNISYFYMCIYHMN